MVTGYEVKMYHDVGEIARSLTSIAASLKKISTILEEAELAEIQSFGTEEGQ